MISRPLPAGSVLGSDLAVTRQRQQHMTLCLQATHEQISKRFSTSRINSVLGIQQQAAASRSKHHHTWAAHLQTPSKECGDPNAGPTLALSCFIIMVIRVCAFHGLPRPCFQREDRLILVLCELCLFHMLSSILLPLRLRMREQCESSISQGLRQAFREPLPLLRQPCASSPC